MIHSVIDFLKTTLNNYLLQKMPDTNLGNAGDSDVVPTKVNYPSMDTDPPNFALRSINILIINIEEEKQLRPCDPYVQLNSDGNQTRVYPPLSLELTLLFAAKFPDYHSAIKHLSYTIQFFQANPFWVASKFPALPSEIDKLKIEFISFNNTQKNEIWSSLKTAYLPSVAYKVSLLVYQEDRPGLDKEADDIETQNNPSL